MVVYYCTAQDVADFLGIDLTVGTAPPTSVINSWINMSEAEIEQRTQHAWREVSASEVHNIGYERSWGLGIKIHLKHRKLRSWDTGKDKLKVRFGSTWEDWTAKPYATPDVPNTNAYFTLFPNEGILYIDIWWMASRDMVVRIDYRYGESSVSADIKEACVKMTAIKFLSNENRWNLLPSGGDVISFRERIDMWKEDVERIIANRTEIIPVGYA